MKKLFSIFLCAIAIISLFSISACGKDTGETPPDDYVSSSSTKSKIDRNDHNSQVSTTSTSLTDSNDSEVDDDSGDGDVDVEGEGYEIDKIDTSTLSANAMVVANLINTLDSITAENFLKKGSAISYAKSSYAKLTASEQAEVTNYNSLLEAEKAYINFKSQYDVAKFKEDYLTIADKSNFDQSDRDVILSLRSMLESFSLEQKEQLEDLNSVQTKVNTAYDQLKSAGLLEWALIVDDCGSVVSGVIPNGGDFFSLTSNISSKSESGDENMKFNNKSMSNALFLKGEESNEPSVSFTASAKGTLTIYAKGEQGKIVVSKNSTAIPSGSSEKYESDCFIASFNIDSSGTYSLTIPGGELYIYAIVFTL